MYDFSIYNLYVKRTCFDMIKIYAMLSSLYCFSSLIGFNVTVAHLLSSKGRPSGMLLIQGLLFLSLLKQIFSVTIKLLPLNLMIFTFYCWFRKKLVALVGSHLKRNYWLVIHGSELIGMTNELCPKKMLKLVWQPKIKHILRVIILILTCLCHQYTNKSVDHILDMQEQKISLPLALNEKQHYTQDKK